VRERRRLKEARARVRRKESEKEGGAEGKVRERDGKRSEDGI